MKKLLMAMIVATALVSCSKEKLNSNSTSSSSTAARNGGVEDNVGTPPAAVATAFKAKFGNVAVLQWKLRSDGTWRAHFMNNGIAWESTYKADGTLVKSERA
jgi:hypothetical protein